MSLTPAKLSSLANKLEAEEIALQAELKAVHEDKVRAKKKSKDED